jgi:hypothetical protein
MLKIEKKISVGNQEFDGYEITGVEWIFKSDTLYVLTEYIYNKRNKNVKRLVKYPFIVGNDINIDELIDQVHKYHL